MRVPSRWLLGVRRQASHQCGCTMWQHDVAGSSASQRRKLRLRVSEHDGSKESPLGSGFLLTGAKSGVGRGGGDPATPSLLAGSLPAHLQIVTSKSMACLPVREESSVRTGSPTLVVCSLFLCLAVVVQIVTFKNVTYGIQRVVPEGIESVGQKVRQSGVTGRHASAVQCSAMLCSAACLALSHSAGPTSTGTLHAHAHASERTDDHTCTCTPTQAHPHARSCTNTLTLHACI